MYPKGYVVINTNVTYLEKEDELDKEVKVREDRGRWVGRHNIGLGFVRRLRGLSGEALFRLVPRLTHCVLCVSL